MGKGHTTRWLEYIVDIFKKFFPLGWPDEVYPNWSTLKITPKFKEQNKKVDLQVVDTSLPLAWTIEGVLLVLRVVAESLLSTYVSRMLPKLLVLQVLDENLPVCLDIKVHKSTALNISFKKKSELSYVLTTLLQSAFPTWLILRIQS